MSLFKRRYLHFYEIQYNRRPAILDLLGEVVGPPTKRSIHQGLSHVNILVVMGIAVLEL